MLKLSLRKSGPSWKDDMKARTVDGHYGLATPTGWDAVIEDLHSKIVELYPDYQVFQIKEKFGELRVACSVSGMEDVKALIKNSTRIANRSCQECGATGVISTKPGPVRVLCEYHDSQDNCGNGYGDVRSWLRKQNRRARLKRGASRVLGRR